MNFLKRRLPVPASQKICAVTQTQFIEVQCPACRLKQAVFPDDPDQSNCLCGALLTVDREAQTARITARIAQPAGGTSAPTRTQNRRLEHQRRDDSAGTGSGKGKAGCWAILLAGVLILLPEGYHGLDSAGLIPHERESFVTAQSNWFVGESKPCSSSPFSAPAEGEKTGYALYSISCDDGPAHEVKVRFWGRKEQREYAIVYWKCIREDSGFTCDELSGLPK